MAGAYLLGMPQHVSTARHCGEHFLNREPYSCIRGESKMVSACVGRTAGVREGAPGEDTVNANQL